MTNKFLLNSGAILCFAVSSLSAQEALEIPIGSIDALESHVLPGQKANLDWRIAYPVTGDPSGHDTRVTAQFITLATGPRNTVLFGTRIGEDGPFVEFYNGVAEEHPDYDLEPGTVIAETLVSAGEEIFFEFLHSKTRIEPFGGVVSTARESNLVITLNRGDAVPTIPPVGGQRSVAEIVEPYSSNGVMTLGSNQQIVLMELFTDDEDHNSYDLQDAVILISRDRVTLEEAAELAANR